MTIKGRSVPTTLNTIKDDVQGSKKKFVKKPFSVMNILAVWGVLITTWIAFTPRLYVYPSASIDPSNPVFTFFVVRNNRHLAICDVKQSASMKYLKLPGDILVVGLGDYTNRFSDPKQVANLIYPGEEYSFLLPFSNLEHNQIENADIAIVLSFRRFRWLPWWRKESLHRFISIKGKDGQWHWLPQPIKK